jgi:hypothetical protein
MNITRGLNGTAVVAHASGTLVERVNNGLMNQWRPPIKTVPNETAEYFFTCDFYFTNSWIADNSNYGEFKFFQFADGGSPGSLWFEPQISFNGGFGSTLTAPDGFNSAQHVGGWLHRAYGPLGAGVTRDQPFNPQAARFLIVPGRWVRFWWLIEINGPSDGFQNTTTLTEPCGAADTTITVDTTTVANGGWQFLQQTLYQAPNYINQTIKIDDEIMIITGQNATSGTPRIYNVTRGAHGTVAAAHADNAVVQASNCYISAWIADEVQEPVQILDRLAKPIQNPTVAATQRRIDSFWVEINTSQDEFHGRTVDFVGYMRNFVALRNPASIAPLLIKPVGDA